MPGGTVENDEALSVAVLREAWEETGLDDLEIAHYLGKQVRDMRDYGKNEIHHRHFYYLTCATRIPQRWQHTELYASESVSKVNHLFSFYRQSLKTIPKLIADFDFYIAQLKRMLG